MEQADEWIIRQVAPFTGGVPAGPPRVIEDTTNYMYIDRGDVIRLHCVAGKGFVSFQEAIGKCPALSGRLDQDDASAFFPYRVMNLRKVFPYLPAKLNAVLLRFSLGAQAHYDWIAQLVDDLYECFDSMNEPTACAGAHDESGAEL